MIGDPMKEVQCGRNNPYCVTHIALIKLWRYPWDILLLIPKAKVLFYVTLGRDLSLNEFRLPQGAGHMYSWRTHLSERRREAATVRIGLFSSNSHENQDERMAINSATPHPSLNQYYVWDMLKFGQRCRVQYCVHSGSSNGDYHH